MSIKAFQTKIIPQEAEHLQALRHLHERFNECLPPVIEALFAMRRGKFGPDARLIFTKITSNQNAAAKLEPLTTPKAWHPRKQEQLQRDWVQAVLRYRAQRGILFDRFKLIPGVGSEFRRKVFETAYAAVDSHLQLVERWKSEHKQWLADKEGWERGVVVREEGEEDAPT